MRNSDWWSMFEELEMYDEAPYGSAACDDEFVGFLTLATEQGSTMNILMDLLEDLASYEQKYRMDLDELYYRFSQGEDVPDIDFLLWSRTYYRFIALSSLARVR